MSNRIKMDFPPPPADALEGVITEVIEREDGTYYRVMMENGVERIIKEDRLIKKIEEN